MAAKKLRVQADKYRRLLWGMTDPEANRELRLLIAESETRAVELEAKAAADRQTRATSEAAPLATTAASSGRTVAIR